MARTNIATARTNIATARTNIAMAQINIATAQKLFTAEVAAEITFFVPSGPSYFDAYTEGITDVESMLQRIKA